MAIAVGVGIFFGRTAVRGPARMPDSERTIYRVRADDFFQIPEFALCPANHELPVAINSQAGRIVSTIFEPLQAFQDNRNGPMGSDIADDSTHLLIIPADIQAGLVDRAAA